MSQYQATRKDFGDFIRRMRVHRGFSQYALARALGYETAQMISNIERGIALIPPKHVEKFAEVLGIDMSVLAYRLSKIEYHRIMEGRTE